MTVIDELIAVLGYKVEGEKELARFKSGVDGAQTKLAAFATWARIAAAAAVAASVATVGAALALGKGVIATSAEFEKYQATLETIEGSSDKAKAALNWASDFAAKTPYELGEVTEAFVRLRAYGLDPLDGTMLAVGDATSAMGKGLMQGVEAIADAATGEFERLKEFGYVSKVAGDQVTFNWQQNGKQMSKTVKKTGKDISNFLKESFGSRFQGAMMRQSKTWNGMTSNLSDAWDRFKLKIGQAGFFDAVRGRLARFLDKVGELDANGTLGRVAQRISDVFVSVLGTIDTFYERVSTHISAIGNLAKRVIEATVGYENFQRVAEAIKIAFAAVPLAIDEVLTYLEGGKTVLAEYIGTFDELKTRVSSAFDVIAAKAREFSSWTGFQDFVGNVRSLIEAFKDATEFVGGFATALAKAADKIPALQGNLDAVGSAFSTFGGWVKWAFEQLQKFIAFVFPTDLIPGDAFKAGQDAAQAFIDVLNTLIGLPQRIIDAFANLGQKIRDAVGFMGLPAMPGVPSSPGAAVWDASPASQQSRNLLDNLGKTQGGAAPYRPDGRPSNTTVNTTVNQTVTQATDAPAAAANATAGAVNRVATPARQAAEPASSGW